MKSRRRDVEPFDTLDRGVLWLVAAYGGSVMIPPEEVILAAQAAQRKWGVPAAISIAQWALESGWGKHMPPGSNNPFGIKAVPPQPSVSVPTREFENGQWATKYQPFRKFASITDAFDLHGQLLATNSAYAAARQYLHNDAAYATALQGHYATDPSYGHLLNAIIQGGNLSQYDVKGVA
jgi:flagellum-specific peptidoglycan hydrolase FlgJ